MSAWMETIIQSVLLLAATLSHHVSCTPPRIAQESSNHLLRAPRGQKNKAESASANEVLHGQRWFNLVGMMGVAASKYVVWPIMILEVTARILSLCPSSTLSRVILPIILPTPPPEVSILPVPPPARPQNLLIDCFSRQFICAVLSISIGFAIRRKCFAAMGRHFSFTHTTLEGHELIRSGPYSVVRHPSYTGEVFVRGGMVLLLLASGGYVRTCGAMLGPTTSFGSLDASQQFLIASVRAGAAYYITWVTFGCTYLIWRAPREDASLRETFGKQWDDYAKEVPYRFIPYVA